MADSSIVMETAGTAESTATEISRLKDKFGHCCRVINSVGDFAHVVSITFKECDVKLKFQISGRVNRGNVNQFLTFFFYVFSTVFASIMMLIQ
jgi:hypothetical protein